MGGLVKWMKTNRHEIAGLEMQWRLQGGTFHLISQGVVCLLLSLHAPLMLSLYSDIANHSYCCSLLSKLLVINPFWRAGCGYSMHFLQKLLSFCHTSNSCKFQLTASTQGCLLLEMTVLIPISNSQFHIKLGYANSYPKAGKVLNEQKNVLSPMPC